MNNLYQRLHREESTLQSIIDKTNSIDSINEITVKAAQINNNYKALIELNNNWNFLREKINEFETIIKNIQIERLNAIEEALEDKFKHYRILENIFNNYNILNNRIENGNKYIEKYEGLGIMDNSLELINSLLIKEKELTELLIKWKDCITNRMQFIEMIESSNNIINNGLTEYEKVLTNIAECPYCKSRIDAEHRKSIVKEMREDYGL